FSECPFWTEVGGAFGGWSDVSRRIGWLQPRLVRQRHVPQLASGVMPRGFRAELEEYLDIHQRLYRTIADVSGAEVVVDATRSAAQLFARRRLRGLDRGRVHRPRDYGGVATWGSKPAVVRAAPKAGELMGPSPPQRLAVLWAALQLECAVLRAAAPYSARV